MHRTRRKSARFSNRDVCRRDPLGATRTKRVHPALVGLALVLIARGSDAPRFLDAAPPTIRRHARGNQLPRPTQLP